MVKTTKRNLADTQDVELAAGGDSPLSLSPETPRKEATAVRPWQCQVALAIIQTAFCIGSVYLKSCLRAVDSSSSGATFHPIIYAFFREAVAGPIMFAIAWAYTGALPQRQDLPKVSLLGVCLFLNQLFFILGIDMSGVVVATCMQPTIPVFTAALAVMLNMESGSVQKFIGIAMAVGGSVSMVLGGVTPSGTGGSSAAAAAAAAAAARNMRLGNACLLANTLAMALYYLTAKQLVARYHPMCVAAWAYLLAATCMGLTSAAIVDRGEWGVPAVLLGPLVYWIVVCSVIGYYVVTWATLHLPASQVAAFQCLQPFVGTVLAYLVLGEQPTLWDLGAVGVVAGLVLIARDRRDGGGDGGGGPHHGLPARPMAQRLRKILSHPAIAPLYKTDKL